MTDNKLDSQKPPEQKDGDENTQPRKPRGLGGVIVIMVLLLALFLLVSNVGARPKHSIYDYYRLLFDGRIYTTTWEDSKIVAEFRDAKNKVSKLEISLGKFSNPDIEKSLTQELAPRTLDTTRYDKGLDRFLDDIAQGKVTPKRAFFLQIHESKDPKNNKDKTFEGPTAYLTAIVQDGNREEYVRVVPGDNEKSTLQTAMIKLKEARVPILDRVLSSDPSTLIIKEPNTTMIYLLGTIGPYILVVLIVWFFILRQMRSPGAGGGVLSFGRSKAAVYTKENRTNITFDDVAGAEEAKDEVREIIEFLKHPGKFAKLGGSIPRGVLLVGPPGTGKTLMAKAIAGEAEVPFFSISGSDFVEMFVGVGASRVRDLFKQARESSPCIVFLDEIDAVGRKRGSGMGGGHDEREQTLNAILVEMDGFDSDKGIILVAATNRPDVLDPALLRPGRFDRQIVIDMPDVKGREAILRVHGRKVKLSSHVDLGVIARATPGFSGAELAAVVNEAAILAAMKGQEAIETEDLEEARDRVRWGREKRSRAIEAEDRKVTAYHEAGHALVAIKIPGLDPVHKVTVVSRGMALGSTMYLPERDDYNTRRGKLLGRIAMCYGGRIAEDVVFGDISVGAQNDIEQATLYAKMMVCELGMSDKVGPINYSARGDSGYLGREHTLAYDLSQDTMELIHSEIRNIVQEQYDRAHKIIVDHRNILDAIANALIQFETISGEEVLAIARGDSVEEFRAAKAREVTPPSKPKEAEQGEPDIGLSGAEGLAH